METYELFALRYATRAGRRPEFFLGGDPHDTPMNIDYFVWVAKSKNHVCMIDTGFNRAMADKRRREFLRDPVDSLELLGVSASQVKDVILTHFHYDHAGNFDRFPNAKLHVQDREMGFATGRYMCCKVFSHSYEPDEVTGLVRKVYQDRVTFHDGDAQVAPGITVHLAAGHTAGIQFAKVHTARGWVVLASDVAHFYETYQKDRPLPQVFHVGDSYLGYRRLREAAETPDHIVPGHDPLVLTKYPAVSPELEGIAVRLDVPPREVS